MKIPSKITFEVDISRRGNFYISVIDVYGWKQRFVKYVPNKKLPTSMAIGSLVGQLIKQRLMEYESQK